MITRNELYELVWSVPTSTIAVRLGVSGSYLMRVCKALDIPRPPQNWWLRNPDGRTMPRLALPPARLGFPDAWEKRGPQPIKPFYRKRTRSVRGETNAESLVRRSAEVFRKAAESPDRTHLVPMRHHVLDLTVSRTALDGALDLAGRILHHLEKAGAPTTMNVRSGHIRPDVQNRLDASAPVKARRSRLWRPLSPTITTIGGVPIGLAIVEMTREEEMRYVGGGQFEPLESSAQPAGITWIETRATPTGLLRCVAYSPRFDVPWDVWWTEKNGSELASRSAGIVAKLVEMAPDLPHARLFTKDPPENG